MFLGPLAASLCWTPLFAQPPRTAESRPRYSDSTPFKTRTGSSQEASQLIPFDALSPSMREKVRRVVAQPTLTTNAPQEEIPALPKTYEWLLDHPDRAALAWRRLGVECAPIQDRGNGRFGWSDNEGSDLTWFTIASGPTARIWYCEGQVRAAAVLPLVPVRAVVVLRHSYDDDQTVPRVKHQVDIFAHADSRAAALVARLFGATTERMAELGSEQLLTFFGALSCYLADHPEKSEQLLAPAKATSRERNPKSEARNPKQ
jgi:hypothetical protein